LKRKEKEKGQIFGFDKGFAIKNLCHLKRSAPLFLPGGEKLKGAPAEGEKL
jgi:hypothetical protein